jgi:hypothetical protein
MKLANLGLRHADITHDHGRLLVRPDRADKLDLAIMASLIAEETPPPESPVALLDLAHMQCDSWQDRILRSPAKRKLLNGTRQGGKSTVAAAKAVYHAITPECKGDVLLLSRAQRQSGELFRKVVTFYRACGRPVPIEQESALKLTLENGKRIISLPGKEETIRSYSAIGLIIVDEASRVPDSLYSAVRPMLAVSEGELWGLSTPYGKRGWWYEAVAACLEAKRSGEAPGWEYYEEPWQHCPRISPEFIEEERRERGDDWVKQEYECQFLDRLRDAFTREEIDNAWDPTLEAWDL